MSSYLPMSRKPSKMLVLLRSMEAVELDLTSGLPGCISKAKAIPSITLKADVSTKKVNVLTAIRPFLCMFSDAVPANDKVLSTDK